MKKRAILVILAVLMFIVVGCKGAAVNMKVVGSTSVDPLMQEFVKAYAKVDKKATIDIEAVGSTGGITAAINGTAQIGMSSRELKAEEISKGLEVYTVAIDGIAVIVNKDNPVSNLTKDQIKKIYMGEITNWNQVGGEDKEIIVVAREASSGTRGAFDEILKVEKEVDGKKVSGLVESAMQINTQGAVKSTVTQQKYSIGYISAGYVDDTIKALTVEGEAPTEENIKSKAYPVARPFILSTKGAATGDAKTFIDWILSDDGQKIVVDKGYVSVK